MNAQTLDLSQLEPEEKRLTARLEDLARMAGNGIARFSAFLNERQQLVAVETVRQRRLDGCLLWGGYPDAARRMLGAFPPWEEPAEAGFPVEAVAIRLPKGAQPSHRDVLGSLMSLGITRESVGDILFSERRCDVFIQKSLAPLLVDELTRIGGFGVRCETGVPGDYARAETFEPLRGTVHSTRMDALVSLLTGLAREKGGALIKAELVQRNYQVVRGGAAEFAAGDVITIRGYGKYRVDEIGSPTKKSRLPVLCSKYV